MERIMDKMENDTVITNPKEPVRTFFRKAGFILFRWADKAKKVFREPGSSNQA
jgi:hypothetical protein